jgi:hypothetical protein
MCESVCSLVDAWSLRNAVADALMKTELHLQRLVEAASVEQLVTLIEAFSPTRALGPDWTRSFEPLVERLWAWGDPAKLAAIEATFRARGPAWVAIANDFTPTRGAELRERLRHPAWARLPAFTLG